MGMLLGLFPEVAHFILEILTSFQGLCYNLCPVIIQGIMGPVSQVQVTQWCHDNTYLQVVGIHDPTGTWLSLPSIATLHLAPDLPQPVQQLIQPIPALQQVAPQNGGGHMMEDVELSGANSEKSAGLYEIEDVEMEDVTPEEVATWMMMLRTDGRLVCFLC